MSGSFSGLNLFPAPVTLGIVPPEGSKVVAVTIPWNTVGVGGAVINLLAAFQSGQFSNAQGVLVDNSTVPYPVTLRCNDTGWTGQVAPFSQAYLPLLVGPQPTFTASLISYPLIGNSYATYCTTQLYFVNTSHGASAFSPMPASYGFTEQATSLSSGGAMILQAPGGNRHYLLYSLSLTAFATLAATTLVQFWLSQTAPGGTRLWNDYVTAPAATNAVFFSKQVTFQPPLLLPAGGATGGVYLSAAPSTTTYQVECALGYGVVTIQ